MERLTNLVGVFALAVADRVAAATEAACGAAGAGRPRGRRTPDGGGPRRGPAHGARAPAPGPRDRPAEQLDGGPAHLPAVRRGRVPAGAGLPVGLLAVR